MGRGVGLTDEQIDKVTHANAMRLFSFDPFAIKPREECTVGALRAQAVGHDVSPVAYGVPEHRITTLGEFVAAASSPTRRKESAWASPSSFPRTAT